MDLHLLFHSWRENMEQLLTFVIFSLLAPQPGRKKNICRPCLCALAGSVTLSFAFFSAFESSNTNRLDVSTGICLLQTLEISTNLPGVYLKVLLFLSNYSCFSAGKSRFRVGDDVIIHWCISQNRWRLLSRWPEFRECHARDCSLRGSGFEWKVRV